MYWCSLKKEKKFYYISYKPLKNAYILLSPEWQLQKIPNLRERAQSKYMRSRHEKKLSFPFSLLCFSFTSAVETENNSTLSDVTTIRGTLSA